MLGNWNSKFKKLLGEQEEQAPQQDEPKAQAEAAPPERAAPEAPPPEDKYRIPPTHPLSMIWDRYGSGGPLTLSLFSGQEPKVPFAPESLEPELRRIAALLESVAQRWLQAEAAAVDARAAVQSRLAAIRAEKEQNLSSSFPGSAGAEEPSAAPLDIDEMGHIVVSADGMVAWIFLLPASGGGKHLTLVDWLALLGAAKVTIGVDRASLIPVFSKRSYFSLCPVAWGSPAQPGQDGQVIDHFSREGIHGGAADDTAVIDYRAQSSVQSIAKDAVICDIIPPVPGVPGVRVDGTPIPPPPSRAAAVPAGANTVLSEDGTQLLSAMDGFLEFRSNAFNVRNLLTIQYDVDYSTGNIDFQGDVVIRGNIREQFLVKATGNVHIDGLVEAATVEAGGEVVISEGISGNGQAVVRCKSIRAKYLENCTIYAEKVESDYIMNCRVFCEDSIIASGSRGAIIGGQIVAANSIKATSVGSDAGRRTEIALGAKPKLREELAANKAEVAAIRAEKDELTKRVLYLQKRMTLPGMPKDAKPPAELVTAAGRLSELAPQEKKLSTRQAELIALLFDLSNCRMECRTLYPGVRITVGTVLKTIESEMHSCTVTFDQETHEICLK